MNSLAVSEQGYKSTVAPFNWDYAGMSTDVESGQLVLLPPLSTSGLRTTIGWSQSSTTDTPSQSQTGHLVETVKVVITQLPADWELIQPITTNLTIDDDGSIVIGDEVFWKYGIGQSVNQARADYVANLLDYYEVVSEYAQEYPEDDALLELLQQYFVKHPQE